MSIGNVHLDKDKGVVDTRVFCKEKTLTKQSAKDECDINKIIARFDKTGMVTHINEREARFGDVSEFTNYAEALRTVQNASDMFMSLSAEVRKKFNNNPEELITFLLDTKNDKEAIELGLINPKEEAEKDVVPSVVETKK